MRYWTIIACGVLFLPPAFLDLIGWDFQARDGAAWMKFHPATYLFVLAAVLPVAAQHRGMLALSRLPRFRFYAVAAVLLTVWALVLTGGASGGGEISSAIVTFVMPTLMLMALTTLSPADAGGLRRFLHWLLIANSLVAIVEYAFHRQVLPITGPVDFDDRSYGVFGHPLASAMMCGLMLVRLILASEDHRAPLLRIGEMALHGVALLTFGGRAALLCLPVAVVATILLARSRRDIRPIGLMRRLGVLGILILGGVLLTLPVGLAQSILGRFGEDAGSAGTRLAAFAILQSLDWKALLFGTNEGVREFLRIAFNTETAVEIAWINLILSYGLIATAIIGSALLTLIFRMTRDMDVSGWGMAVYFFAVQSTSIGFGTKSVAIAQVLLLMLVFCGARAPIARGAVRVRLPASDPLRNAVQDGG